LSWRFPFPHDPQSVAVLPFSAILSLSKNLPAPRAFLFFGAPGYCKPASQGSRTGTVLFIFHSLGKGFRTFGCGGLCSRLPIYLPPAPFGTSFDRRSRCLANFAVGRSRMKSSGFLYACMRLVSVFFRAPRLPGSCWWGSLWWSIFTCDPSVRFSTRAFRFWAPFLLSLSLSPLFLIAFFCICKVPFSNRVSTRAFFFQLTILGCFFRSQVLQESRPPQHHRGSSP